MVYKEHPFDDCEIKSLIHTACEYYDRLTNDTITYGKIDAVIPLTHGRIEIDRKLAAMRPFCCIIGGHEHEVFDETVKPYDCQVLKTGMDGINIGICEIRWDDVYSTRSVSIRIQKDVAKLYTADPLVQELVNNHKSILNDLEKSHLCNLSHKNVSSRCAEDVEFPLSSKEVRLRPASMATFLCSVVRDEMNTDCCLINGGGIRGKSSYTERSFFSFADLKKELPFQDLMIVIKLPGSVIAETICHSRASSLESTPVEVGHYMQTDNGIEWDVTSNAVIRIAKEPLDKDRMYSVAVSAFVLEYIKSQRQNKSFVHKAQDSGIEIKELIVSHFARTILFQFLKTFDDFDLMDTNHDLKIDKTEFHEYMKELQKQKNEKKRKLESDQNDTDAHVEVATGIMIDNLFNILDENGDGFITKEEYRHFLDCQKTI